MRKCQHLIIVILGLLVVNFSLKSAIDDNQRHSLYFWQINTKKKKDKAHERMVWINIQPLEGNIMNKNYYSICFYKQKTIKDAYRWFAEMNENLYKIIIGEKIWWFYCGDSPNLEQKLKDSQWFRGIDLEKSSKL